MARIGGIHPNLGAFLDLLAWSEIGPWLLAHSDDGYNVLVGSHGPTATQAARLRLFPSYAAHPNVYERALDSTAAGRYQLLHRWWPPYRDALRLPDFGPESQDRIALRQIAEAGASADIEAGRLEAAVARCAHLWASLPGAGYGQREQRLADLASAFVKAGGQPAKETV